jgi:hypothetical protein
MTGVRSGKNNSRDQIGLHQLTLEYAWSWKIAASFGCLIFAILIWANGLPKIDTTSLNDYGLVAILPIQHWVALVLLTVGFVLSLDSKIIAGPLPLLHLIALVVIIHLTPALIYETVRYPWVWKHIGIVDFIQRHGTVDRSAQFLQAYHNWPGLFFVSAWIANLLGLGVSEIANIVRFAPAAFGFAFVFALMFLYRSLSIDPRVTWIAIWTFLTANWVSQDYYSPQAAAFFLYIIVLSLCLGVLKKDFTWTGPTNNPLRRYSAIFVNFISRNPEAQILRPIKARPTITVVFVLAAILAIIVTHQLTPLALILALAALSALGQLHIGYVAFAVIAEILWLSTFASPFVLANLDGEFKTFGQGLTSATNRLVDLNLVSTGRWWVVFMGRAAVVLIGAAAIIGGIRRIITGYRDGVAAILLLSPIILFVNSYGGEILFRIYLFALPFLAFFASVAFCPTPNRGESWTEKLLLGIFCLLLTIGFLFANNGKDLQYTYSADEVAASNWLYENAPPATLLIEGSREYPSQFKNYEKLSYFPIYRESAAERTRILANPADIIAEWFSDKKWKAGYVIITRGQKNSAEVKGIEPIGGLDRLEASLLQSPRFIVVHSTKDAKIFALKPAEGLTSTQSN